MLKDPSRRPRTEAASTVEDLVLDLLDWLAARPRPYAEVMEAWRTSCPRLSIWEDAVERGYVTRTVEAERGPVVAVSPVGLQRLKAAAR